MLTTLPSSKLEWKIFRLEGDRATFRELADIYGTTVAYVDEVPGEGKPFTRLHALADSGRASTGWDVAAQREGKEAAGSSNSLWAGHHWKSIKEFYSL